MPHDVCPGSDEISQDFGCTDYSKEWPARWCPGGHFHAGIDLGYSTGGNHLCGAPVHATRAGLVVAMQDPNGYLGDQAVCIHADEGVFIELGHLDSRAVIPGQRVSAGDIVGHVGSRGASSACHLHVEVRRDGPYQRVNPSSPDTDILDPRPYLDRVVAQPTSPEDDDMAQISIAAGGHDQVLGFYADGGHQVEKLCLLAAAGDGHTAAAAVDLYLAGQTGQAVFGPVHLTLSPDHEEVVEVARIFAGAGRIGHFAAIVNNHAGAPVKAARRAA